MIAAKLPAYRPEPTGVVLTLPPVPEFKVGDRCVTEIYFAGLKREVVGVVTAVGWAAEDSDALKWPDRPFQMAGTVRLTYEMALPPKNELRPTFHKHYPKDGIHRGEMTCPLDQVRPYHGEQLDFDNTTLEPTPQSTGAIAPLEPKVAYVDQSTLESFAELYSGLSLTEDKIKGVLKWGDRQWVVIACSSEKLKTLSVTAMAVVPQHKWDKPSYTYSELNAKRSPDEALSRAGQRVRYRKNQVFVLTGEEIEFKAIIDALTETPVSPLEPVTISQSEGYSVFPLTEGQAVLYTAWKGQQPQVKTIQKIAKDRFGNWRVGFRHADPRFADSNPVDWVQIPGNFTNLEEYGIEAVALVEPVPAGHGLDPTRIQLPIASPLEPSDRGSGRKPPRKRVPYRGGSTPKQPKPHVGVQPPIPGSAEEACGGTTPNDRAEIIHDSLARLEQERDRLLQEGLAPEGAWIECGKVKGKTFRQAYWRAVNPIFQPARKSGDSTEGVKRKYIGEESSPEHKAAMAMHQRRKEWEKVCRQIKLLTEEMDG